MKHSSLAVLFGLNAASAFTSCPSSARVSTKRLASAVEGIPVTGEVKPTNNFVLVKVAEELEQTETGILLTGSAKIAKTEGKVISVGPGKTHPETGEPFDMPVETGDSVVYGKYDGTALDIDGVKHTLIRDDDVLVKFKGDELKLDTADVTRDNVLIDVERQEATEGGLLLGTSNDSETKPSTGKVVKVGPGRFANRAMGVAPEDNVRFRNYAGNEVEIEGKEYSVVRMEDILAKF